MPCRVDASQAPRFLGLGWKIFLGFQAQEETGLEAAQVPQVESKMSMCCIRSKLLHTGVNKKPFAQRKHDGIGIHCFGIALFVLTLCFEWQYRKLDRQF